jgi:hypothetical protein
MHVAESVSVVLRRQVPPRSEAPRSWLGGLPMMPAHVAWPRSISAEFPERGERPLHFLAQIACADLPAELWGGLGPRRGWLLFFIDPNQYQPEGPDALRVVHIESLGSERAAPADLGPVDDGEHTSAYYDHFLSLADRPSVWRRWPVDLVAVANNDETLVTTQDLEAYLYPGQAVAEAAPKHPEPFTWRGALYVLNRSEHDLTRSSLYNVNVSDAAISRLRQPGYIDTILPAFDDAKWRDEHRTELEGPEPEDRQERERRKMLTNAASYYRSYRAALADLLQRYATPNALIDFLNKAGRDYLSWRKAARKRIDEDRATVLSHDLDSPMPAATWQAIKDRLQRDTIRFWSFDWDYSSGEESRLEITERDDRAYTRNYAGLGDLMADYYVDVRRRKLIAPSVLAIEEAYWRLLVDRPHRMGGRRDAVQPDDHSADELLLLQIACDGAMNWWWADVGALYIFIDVESLKRGDLLKARMTLESH